MCSWLLQMNPSDYRMTNGYSRNPTISSFPLDRQLVGNLIGVDDPFAELLELDGLSGMLFLVSEDSQNVTSAA
jgi:hypothetical protein